MSVNILNKLRNIVIGGTFLYLVNVSISPLVNRAIVMDIISGFDSKHHPPHQEAYLLNIEDKEHTALYYLKIATAEALSNLETSYFDKLIKERDNNNDGGLIDMKYEFGSCIVKSVNSYYQFVNLVNTINRGDLLDYVRLAYDSGGNTETNPGHVWLEVMLKGKWVPYETTTVNIDSTHRGNIDFSSIDGLILDSETLNRDDFKYNRRGMVQFEKDGKINGSVDLFGMLSNYEGIFSQFKISIERR